MFGDIAHGFITFCFGLFLLYQNANSSNALIRALFPYRYLIAMMGFFATYCGFVYNDFLSLPLNLFSSCYDRENAVEEKPIHRLDD
jgi:V-type H+-transporting ATPase subunit a